MKKEFLHFHCNVSFSKSKFHQCLCTFDYNYCALKPRWLLWVRASWDLCPSFLCFFFILQNWAISRRRLIPPLCQLILANPSLSENRLLSAVLLITSARVGWPNASCGFLVRCSSYFYWIRAHLLPPNLTPREGNQLFLMCIKKRRMKARFKSLTWPDQPPVIYVVDIDDQKTV